MEDIVDAILGSTGTREPPPSPPPPDTATLVTEEIRVLVDRVVFFVQQQTNGNNNTTARGRHGPSIGDDLLCPITLELPFDPVVAEDG